MSFRGHAVEDLIRIAAVGGGFRLDAMGRETGELVRIAAAAVRGHAQVTFAGMESRPVNDLIQIGAAGKGHVVFIGIED